MSNQELLDITKIELESLEAQNIEFTSEEFIPSNNIGNFLEIASKIEILDVLPIKKLDIKFSDDTWDFSPLLATERVKLGNTSFIFDNIPKEFKRDSKLYIYWSIAHDERRKISIDTLYGEFSTIRTFLEHLHEEAITSINSIDSSFVLNYIDNLKDSGLSNARIIAYIGAINSLLRFYGNEMTNKDFSPLISKLKDISAKLYVLMRNDENRKTKNIPNEYFNKLLSSCIRTMNCESLDVNTRGYAAMVVLLSQTGLRSRQLCALKANAVTKVSILNNTRTAYFLEFIEIKRRIQNAPYTTGKTILNELGYQAYKLLEELFESRRKKFKTDYLFCPLYARSFPIDPLTLNRNFKKLIVNLGSDIDATNVSDKYPELETLTISEYKEMCGMKKEKTVGTYKNTDVISYAKPHQFRVHLCTELYYKNIPFQVIQHYMNHLSEDMVDYYVRREDYTEREDDFANAVIRTIVEEGTAPLGSGSDKLMVKINEFIKKGKFNVSKDIDTIISELKRRMPIKEKLGGICIKSGFKRECSKDGQSDEIYCSYGVCPNHFHLYTMADISYTRCKTLYKTMEHNKTQGFIRQSQKEKNKLVYVTENSLKPELEQLKDKMKDKGSDWIKNKYPALIPIIDNLDTITKEVESWMKLKETK